MKRKFSFIFTALFLAAIACNFPGAEANSEESTPTLTFTSIPTDTPTKQLVVSDTPTPTSVIPDPVYTPTSTSVPCNRASFVQDMTIPDGTQIIINESFTKTWKLKNTGSCTWTSTYALVFDSGSQMGGPSSKVLTNSDIAPGATIDISVDLVAPNDPGTYRGNWMLKEPGGTLFGLSTGAFWVEIQAVPKNQPTTFNIPGWPTYQKGANGPNIYAIQYLLNFHGQNLNPDGAFGNQTQMAVKNFQTQSGLTADGIVGPQTWDALIQGAQVSQGISNDAVKAVQILLRDKYGHSLTIDGVFGAGTANAVKDFQSTYALGTDGIVGSKTWRALVTLK